MIQINLSDHDKKILRIVGNGPYGKEFVRLLEKVRSQVCSLETIDPNRDTATQVEGRLAFKEFSDELITRMTQDKKQHQAVETDEFD